MALSTDRIQHSHQHNYCGKWIEMNRNTSDELRFEEAISIHLQLRAKCSTEDAGQDRFLRRGLCPQEASENIRLQHAVMFRQLS